MSDAITDKLIRAGGDLAALTEDERVTYYHTMCDRAGLDPAGLPFSYLKLSGRLTLYAGRQAAEQIARRDGLSTELVSREVMEDVVHVVARVTGPDRRVTERSGTAVLSGSPEARANALLRAETKACRRAVLAHAGLGMLDETEVASIGAEQEPVGPAAGTGRQGGPTGGITRQRAAELAHHARMIGWGTGDLMRIVANLHPGATGLGELTEEEADRIDAMMSRMADEAVAEETPA